MGSYSFGRRSLENLRQLHPDLQQVHLLAIKRSKVDYSIVEAYRTTERQQELYAIGRSKYKNRRPVTNADGVIKKSKHQTKPSIASDIMVYNSSPEFKHKTAWDEKHLSYLAGVFDSVAQELYDKGVIGHLVRWGGNWDNDGVIQYDHKFNDMPHIELRIV
jgi:peptidoglycan L-alanyl-D-glutamate endopeptidase CwlK